MSSSRIFNMISRHIVKRATGFTQRQFAITKRVLSPKPLDFNNEFYWLTNIDENNYAYGITHHFMEEHGEPQMIFLEVDIDDVLMEGDVFAVLENEKTSISLEAPFDNAKLIHLDEDLNFDVINEDPENIESKICLFQDLDDFSNGTNTYISGGSNNQVYQIPLL
jgi:glycine cleavage system H lipoate-binding protein